LARIAMHPSSVVIDSKLPWVGTTIFTVMSKLAADCGAINLSQGFPDFQAEPALFDATLAMRCAGETSIRRWPVWPNCARRSPTRSQRSMA
jgi:hypothetical protein